MAIKRINNSNVFDKGAKYPHISLTHWVVKKTHKGPQYYFHTPLWSYCVVDKHAIQMISKTKNLHPFMYITDNRAYDLTDKEYNEVLGVGYNHDILAICESMNHFVANADFLFTNSEPVDIYLKKIKKTRREINYDKWFVEYGPRPNYKPSYRKLNNQIHRLDFYLNLSQF